MSKQIILTGCAGFIGSHLLEYFLSRGHIVLGIDNLGYAANKGFIEQTKLNYPRTFEFLEKNICDLDKLPNCDYVINLAAESHVDNSILDSSKFIESNIEGVDNLLKLIINSIYPNKPIFIQMSTDEVYGDGDKAHTEEDSLNPSSPYAASKASADLLIKSYARTYGIKYKIIRPSNTYGTRQYPEKLIPLVIKQLKFGRKIFLHDGGTPSRSWTHVSDVCFAAGDIVFKGEENSIYNVSSGLELRNREVVDTLIHLYHSGRPYSDIKNTEDFMDLSYERLGQDVRYRISSDKLRKEMGWHPTMFFEEGLEECVEFYKKELRW